MSLEEGSRRIVDVSLPPPPNMCVRHQKETFIVSDRQSRIESMSCIGTVVGTRRGPSQPKQSTVEFNSRNKILRYDAMDGYTTGGTHRALNIPSLSMLCSGTANRPPNFSNRSSMSIAHFPGLIKSIRCIVDTVHVNIG